MLCWPTELGQNFNNFVLHAIPLESWLDATVLSKGLSRICKMVHFTRVVGNSQMCGMWYIVLRVKRAMRTIKLTYTDCAI